MKNKRKITRILFFLAVDIVSIISAVFLSFLIRFEGQLPGQYYLNIAGIIVLALPITIPLFSFFKLYSFTWIYVSATELISLLKSLALSFLILTAAFFILKGEAIFTGFPRSTLFITYFFMFLLCGGSRFAKRIYLEMFQGFGKKGKKEKTLIVGAGMAGEQILRNILSSRDAIFLPAGFVDDDLGKQGIFIHGIKVLGKIEDIPGIAVKEKIEGMIIALPSAGSSAIKRAVEYGRQAGLKKIKIVPSINEANLGTLQEVSPENLLGRESVSLDQGGLIGNFIKDKKILVTGAAGSIGSELCRQLIKFEPGYLFLLDQDETGIFNISEEILNNFSRVGSFIADVTDEERMERIFQSATPDIVFHAAAYKHVPLMEAGNNIEEAIKNNIFGTKLLAAAALRRGVKTFIFISTDKAVNPSSVMGATKRIGEMICQSLSGQTKFISVRFGNVLNSRGNVIQTFKERIEKRKRGEAVSIEITHPEMKRYFMTTEEACLLVLQAGAMGQGGEVFVLDMGKPIKIADLARDLIRLSGLEPDKDIPIVITHPRPGEKLFEEILSAEEGTTATENQKIFKAKLSEVNSSEMDLKLDKIREAVKLGDKDGAVKILKEIVPNYKLWAE